jgi:Domain of unknown function (DUF397)
MSGEVRWRKSSRSSSQGGNCVEVAQWRKSSRSSDQGGACVEVARLAVGRPVTAGISSSGHGRVDG